MKKKMEKLEEILIAIVDEMYTYGHFMSETRARDLIKRIETLNNNGKPKMKKEGGE